jgi:hypothetical protein
MAGLDRDVSEQSRPAAGIVRHSPIAMEDDRWPPNVGREDIPVSRGRVAAGSAHALASCHPSSCIADLIPGAMTDPLTLRDGFPR